MKLTNREQQILDFAILVITIITLFIVFMIFIYICPNNEKVHFRDAVHNGELIDGNLIIKPAKNEF